MAGARWTEQDERDYREWAEQRPYAPPRDIETPSPLWVDALIMCGVFAFCAAFWTGLVWLLFF